MSKDKLEIGDVWINTETKAKFVVLDFIKSIYDGEVLENDKSYSISIKNFVISMI